MCDTFLLLRFTVPLEYRPRYLSSCLCISTEILVCIIHYTLISYKASAIRRLAGAYVRNAFEQHFFVVVLFFNCARMCMCVCHQKHPKRCVYFFMYGYALNWETLNSYSWSVRWSYGSWSVDVNNYSTFSNLVDLVYTCSEHSEHSRVANNAATLFVLYAG